MDVQVAGPSRTPTGFDSASRDRQRQLASNKKAERVLGASVPAPFLRLDTGNKGTTTQTKEVVLNSPISKCPTSFLPWSSRSPIALRSANAAPTCASHAITNQVELPATMTLTSVAPLNFRRRSHRKSFSMTRIETEMTDYKRDAAQNFEHHRSNTQADSHWQRTGEPYVARRQSLPETSSTVLRSSEGFLKRHPRPLPPVPLSRPVSPASSISSSHNSRSSPRPLPAPPKQAPVIDCSPITFAPAPESPSVSTYSEPSTPLCESEQPPAPAKSRPESNLFSPLSPLSIITDLPGTLRVPSAPSPRSSEARKRHRIHASPYKLCRNPTRYSTTSLSSQVSVPPAPSSAELRRRNREKMAKLIRVLGESPPSDMVFPAERDHMRDSVETTTEESVECMLPIVLEPLRRSVSLGPENSTISLFGKKKALSDPDAGHGEHAQSPTEARITNPAPFRRLRSKRGRADVDKAPRYVFSLFDIVEEKTSERLAFKLNAATPKLRPTGSYLRGAYKTDQKPIEARIPPLPTKIPGIDLPKHAQKWVRESGLNRWEVDDYENVVMSLRKL